MSQYVGSLFPLLKELYCDSAGRAINKCVAWPELAQEPGEQVGAVFETEQDLWAQYGSRHWVAELRHVLVECLMYIYLSPNEY